jgi:hypothetical protein
MVIDQEPDGFPDQIGKFFVNICADTVPAGVHDQPEVIAIS